MKTHQRGQNRYTRSIQKALQNKNVEVTSFQVLVQVKACQRGQRKSTGSKQKALQNKNVDETSFLSAQTKAFKF